MLSKFVNCKRKYDEIIAKKSVFGHYHKINPGILPRQQISNSVKRKAVEDISYRPYKLIQKERATLYFIVNFAFLCSLD